MITASLGTSTTALKSAPWRPEGCPLSGRTFICRMFLYLRGTFTMASGKDSQTFLQQEREALAYAKKGIILAALSGLIFSVDGMLIKSAGDYAPFSNPALWLLVPLICAGLHDLCAGLVVTFLTWRSGRLAELWRSLASKPGRSVLAGALMGSLIGMSGYMTALQMAGPAYVLPITTMYPAVAAVLAVFVLKEKIPLRGWIGLSFCVLGAAAVGYTPPDGQTGSLFYWGLFFAAMAAVGWGVEGVLATSGMDFVEPSVALNIYYLVSVTVYIAILIPLVSQLVYSEQGGLALPLDFIASKGVFFLLAAGAFGGIAYSCWYKAMHMTGVSRAMALYISYALWGILLSSLFTEVHITVTLVVGALVIFTGMFLVVGNPRDMLNLRKTD